MSRISVNLWFENQAEEAANFYTSIFKHSKIKDTTYYGEAGARASGAAAVGAGGCDGADHPPRRFDHRHGSP